MYKLGFGLGLLLIIVCMAVSWVATCGVIKLITMCFGLKFTWKAATGIYLVLLLIGSAFKSGK